jgi:hypothetical protein
MQIHIKTTSPRVTVQIGEEQPILQEDQFETLKTQRESETK